MLSYPRQKRIAVALGTLFVVLCALYGVINPVFEAPDEVYHYPYVKYVADGLGLPVQQVGQEALWEQEGSQPPLYYMLAAGLTFWVDTDDLTTARWMNPHVIVGEAHATDNKNMVIHTPQERFPWSGTVLAVHLARLLSLVLGLGTIWCTWRIASKVLPGRPVLALGAMAINALNPMFIFLSASVNNDNLVIFLSSLTMLQLVRLIQDGSSRKQRLLLGLTVGLACLTKLSGLGLAMVTALAVILRVVLEAWPERVVWETIHVTESQRRNVDGTRWEVVSRLAGAIGLQGIEIGLLVLLVAGWWYVRNVVLYGELFGMQTMLGIVGHREHLPTLVDALAEFKGFSISLWGLFGVFNVLIAPDWIYWLLDGIVVVAVAGMVRSVVRLWLGRRRVPSPDILLLLFWTMLVIVLLVRWTAMTLGSQGRLIYPAISGGALLLAAGLCHWFQPRRHGAVLGAFAAALLGLSLVSPWTAIRPTYAAPPPLTQSDIPSEAQRFGATYGDAVTLLAFEVSPRTVSPGEAVCVTLYWQLLERVTEDYSVYVHLFGWDGESLGQRDTYPGGGRTATSLLNEGQVVKDVIYVPVSASSSGPVAARVEAGLYHLSTMVPLSVTDSEGNDAGRPELCRIKVDSPASGWIGGPGPVALHRTESSFNRQVKLVFASVPEEHSLSESQTLGVVLFWEALADMAVDYTVFVHLVDSEGNVLGQGDAQPMGGVYPTSFWGFGDRLHDEHTIHFDSQVQLAEEGIQGRIQVGFYDLESGRRLPYVNADGSQIGDSTLAATVWLRP